MTTEKPGEEIMTNVLTGMMDDLARAKMGDDARAKLRTVTLPETPKPPGGWDSWLDYVLAGCPTYEYPFIWMDKPWTPERVRYFDAARAELRALRAENARMCETLAMVQKALTFGPPKTGSIVDALRKSHEAGGYAWDKVDDPTLARRLAFEEALAAGGRAGDTDGAKDAPAPVAGTDDG